MKRLLDINMWIALTLETHPQHKSARQWYEKELLLHWELVFCRPTEMGFLRLITQEKVMNRCSAAAMTNSEAVKFLANVYDDRVVSRADEPPATRALWLELADHFQAAPNLWMDAYLAAFAIALDAQMVTFDRGFDSFVRHGLNLALLQST